MKIKNIQLVDYDTQEVVGKLEFVNDKFKLITENSVLENSFKKILEEGIDILGAPTSEKNKFTEVPSIIKEFTLENINDLEAAFVEYGYKLTWDIEKED